MCAIYYKLDNILRTHAINWKTVDCSAIAVHCSFDCNKTELDHWMHADKDRHDDDDDYSDKQDENEKIL